MKRYLLILFTICCSASHAQQSYLYFTWDVNTPLTNKNWINNTSVNGAKAGYRHFIGDESRFAVGIDLNWAYYQEYKATETFQNPGGAITTDYFNEVFQIGLAANGQYYFSVGDRQHFFPYAGLALGANRNDYSVYYNIYEDQESKWGFLARPEAGILVRIGTRRKLGAMAAIHYDYSTADSSNYGYNSFSTFGFQLGVMLMQW